jgi:CubicO group peptidase (beta-lactamase class C family)
MRTFPVTVLVFFLAIPALAAAQEILSDATDTATLSASDPFSGHAAGPYSPSEVSRNAPGTGLNKGDLPKIRKYVEQVMAQWEVPGTAVIIVQNGETFMSEGFGVLELTDTAQVNEDTIFCIGSTTKAFTATAISMLDQDGLMDWDEPIMSYYPFTLQDPDLAEQILMRDAISHRTGFDGLEMDSYLLFNRPAEWRTRYQIVDNWLDRFSASWPIRSKWSYNSVYYLLAGVAMEEVTGKTWEETIGERIFEPLGMDRSQTVFNEYPDNNWARIYEWRPNRGIRKFWSRGGANAAPAGGVHSTAIDMAKWLKFQLGKGTYEGEELLEAQYFDDMLSPHIAIDDPNLYYAKRIEDLGIFRVNAYGLGWVLSEYQSKKVAHHAGSCFGARALVLVIPEEGFGIAILMNLGVWWRENLGPESLAYRIMDEYFGQAKRDWSTEIQNLEVLPWP